MATESNIISKAEFNPKIKTYLLIYGSLVLICTIIGIVILPIFLAIGPYFIKKYFGRLTAELTSRALRFQKGYLFHVERTIPLDKIQDLTFKEGPLLRYFGLSVLKVETAGGSGQGQADLTLIGIQQASEFRNEVLKQRDKVTENKYNNTETDNSENTLHVLKEIRDSLKVIEQNVGK